MTCKLEKKENNVAEIKLEFELTEFKEAIARAYKKSASKYNIPGFRKGKAPQFIIEKYYGEGVFYEDAINILLPDAYDKAIEELALEPVDRPEFDIERIGEGENPILTVKVTVKPEVTLGKYKGIEIDKIEYNVGDDEINAEIENVRQRNARIREVEDRPAKSGDTLNIDFEGFVDGAPFPGGKADGHSLELGSGQFIPGFEEQLEGKKVGDECEVKVTFPAEYHAEELAGKDAVFKVKVNKITENELPDCDDELAKDVSEFDTIEEYKASIRERLEKEAARRTKTETENAILNAVAENLTVDLPDCMVENEIESMARDYDMRLSQQGLNFERFLQMTGQTFDDFKERYREEARKSALVKLAMEAVAKAESIEVDDSELEARYAELAEEYKTELDKVKKALSEEMIKAELINIKTVALLVENAKISEAKKATKTTKTASTKKSTEAKPAKKMTKAEEKTTKTTKTAKTTKPAEKAAKGTKNA